MGTALMHYLYITYWNYGVPKFSRIQRDLFHAAYPCCPITQLLMHVTTTTRVTPHTISPPTHIYNIHMPSRISWVTFTKFPQVINSIYQGKDLGVLQKSSKHFLIYIFFQPLSFRTPPPPPPLKKNEDSITKYFPNIHPQWIKWH